MAKFEVTRYYTIAEVYIVEAENENDAYDAACDDMPVKTYDGDYDSNYEVMEISRGCLSSKLITPVTESKNQ